jgi:hypothetical protein
MSQPLILSVEVEKIEHTRYSEAFVLRLNGHEVVREKTQFSSLGEEDAEMWAAEVLGKVLAIVTNVKAHPDARMGRLE